MLTSAQVLKRLFALGYQITQQRLYQFAKGVSVKRHGIVYKYDALLIKDDDYKYHYGRLVFKEHCVDKIVAQIEKKRKSKQKI